MDLKLFALACVIFLALDAGWISYNYKYYADLVLKIQKEQLYLKTILIPVAYLFIFTSLYFCIRLIELELKSNNEKNNMNKYLKIIFISAIFGLAVYGTYAYTNCIFLKNYGYMNAFIDTIWAIVLYTIPSVIYFSLV